MKPKFSENPKEWRKGAWMSALGLAIFSSLLRWRRVLRPTTWVIVLAILAAIAVAAAIQPIFRKARFCHQPACRPNSAGGVLHSTGDTGVAHSARARQRPSPPPASQA
jgi:hypothetical protein